MTLLEGDIKHTRVMLDHIADAKGISVATLKNEFNSLEKRLKELAKEGKTENDPEVQKIASRMMEMRNLCRQSRDENEKKMREKNRAKAADQTPISSTSKNPSATIAGTESPRPPSKSPNLPDDNSPNRSMKS